MTVHPQIIDVSAGHRAVDPSLFSSTLSLALHQGGQIAARSDRYDAEGPVDWNDAIDAYARRVDGDMAREMGNQKVPPHLVQAYQEYASAHRMDTFPVGAGGFPREFEFIRSQIFEEKRQPLTAAQFFPVDASVPLGARKHTARRSLGSGEAQIYRGGTEIPRARTTFVEETFGVAFIVCAVDTMFFDALTTDWANLQQYQRDTRLAIRLVQERQNRVEWLGDTGSLIPGVINYPSLAKKVISTAFTSASAGEDVAEALADLANTPMVQSGGTFSPNRCAVSPTLYGFLTSRKHSTTGGTDLTIAEYFLRNHPGITKLEMAPELDRIGPSSSPEDGILCWRDDLETVGRVEIQAPTALPVVQNGPLTQTTVIFAATGGVVMPDVGNCILGLVAAR